MIPSKFIEELKNASDDKADFAASFVEVSSADARCTNSAE